MRTLNIACWGLAAALIAVAGCGDDADGSGQGGAGQGGASQGGASGASGSSGSSSAGTTSGGSGAATTGGSGGAGAATTGGSGGAGGSSEGYYVELTLPAPTKPSPVGDASVTFYQDIAYGEDPLLRFDLIKPAGSEATPLVIFIHGGGFTGGAKEKAYENTSGPQSLFDAKIAYASLNYRVLSSTALDPDGVIKPLMDSKRALQFIRYHASELGIDPTKVALRGGSAGAGTSLWLAFHDDMADPSATDPVFRQSTRVVTVAANSTQSTYDLGKWTDIFQEYGVDVLGTDDPSFQLSLASFYGLPSTTDIPGQLDTPAMKAYRANVDILGLMTADDPPFYVHNALPKSSPIDNGKINTGVLNHHPYHAKALNDRGAAVGVNCSATIDALGVDENSGSDWDYLINAL